MSNKIQSYVAGRWHTGNGDGEAMLDAIDGSLIGFADNEGVDLEACLKYGRKQGAKLRKLTFHERGRMLKALAFYLLERKEQYYELSYRTGATRIDSWIDIEGGIGNLFSYASLRRQFPDESFYVDGETAKISKGGSFIAQHIMVPKTGVAVHINAYNFPVWGMLEKIAVNLLAGMPAVVKPATPGSFLTEAVFRDIIGSGIFPEGVLQLICGQPRDLLDHVTLQDVVTFTGSAKTGKLLRQHPRIISESVSFTMEADSLNCAVLGEDAVPGTEDFDIYIKEVCREITVKAGQKCTAVRRIIVPTKVVDDVKTAIVKRLSQTVIGDPRQKEVRMGALVGLAQRSQVQERIADLSKYSTVLYGADQEGLLANLNTEKGAFMAPVLLLNEHPFEHTLTHELEAFGPVSTIMPYNDLDEAVMLAQMGKGSLVSTIVTSDTYIAKEYVLNAAAYHGRVQVLNSTCAKESTGHGSPLPLLIHGGPGRAGGGEEMGGIRGVKHYLQRTAVQGHPTMLTAITNVYQQGGAQQETDIHPFRKHFEDLAVGETLITAKHTVIEADITNFANVSGDHFYAHMDATSLDGTIFERRVAHGYYILSKAAGLFVEAKKGPVLLNYGIDEARFTKPVYPGMTIGVKLTVKEKTAQELRDENDVPKGIVKWLVEVYDETNETVAIATILTMVKRKNNS